ncbi:MAG: FAD-binding oxidoreductase [Polyangiaceae bacterium]|nr:FAD-binding oxidoreductase [Polyangiaceae bacterium]
MLRRRRGGGAAKRPRRGQGLPLHRCRAVLEDLRCGSALRFPRLFRVRHLLAAGCLSLPGCRDRRRDVGHRDAAPGWLGERAEVRPLRVAVFAGGTVGAAQPRDAHREGQPRDWRGPAIRGESWPVASSSTRPPRRPRASFTIGHFPSSILCSTVGGWIAARGAGQCSGLYGKIEDMVVSADCVLGTGESVTLQRRFGGPTGLPLMIGSEGTLGIITRARLRLPAQRAFVAYSYADIVQGWGAKPPAASTSGLRLLRARLGLQRLQHRPRILDEEVGRG